MFLKALAQAQYFPNENDEVRYYLLGYNRAILTIGDG
jgi:hypothetical protein